MILCSRSSLGSLATMRARERRSSGSLRRTGGRQAKERREEALADIDDELAEDAQRLLEKGVPADEVHRHVKAERDALTVTIQAAETTRTRSRAATKRAGAGGAGSASLLSSARPKPEIVDAVRDLERRAGEAETATGAGAARGGAGAGGAATAAAELGELPFLVASEVHVDKGKVLGSGRSGDVFRGTFRGDPVAVKVVFMRHSQKMQRAQKREVFIHRQLSVSPHVVQLFGVVQVESELRLVMQLCACTLDQFVHGGDDMAPHPQSGDFGTCLRLMRELSAGLAYLHGCGLLHRDLKPANVLLSAALTVKLADFGLAREASGSVAETVTVAGTAAYMAPELLQEEVAPRYSRESDIYALGIVANEVMARQRPFAGVTWLAMKNAMKAGERPVLFDAEGDGVSATAHLREEMGALVQRLWSTQACDRPTAREAVLEVCSIYMGLEQALREGLPLPPAPSELQKLLASTAVAEVVAHAAPTPSQPQGPTADAATTAPPPPVPGGGAGPATGPMAGGAPGALGTHSERLIYSARNVAEGSPYPPFYCPGPPLQKRERKPMVLCGSNGELITAASLAASSAPPPGGSGTTADGAAAPVVVPGRGAPGPMMRPGRYSVVLHDILSNTPEAEVCALFSGLAPIKSLRSDIADTWFVTFESEQEAKDTINALRSRTFKGEAIKARLKFDTSFDPTGAGSVFIPEGVPAPPSVPFMPYHPYIGLMPPNAPFYPGFGPCGPRGPGARGQAGPRHDGKQHDERRGGGGARGDGAEAAAIGAAAAGAQVRAPRARTATRPARAGRRSRSSDSSSPQSRWGAARPRAHPPRWETWRPATTPPQRPEAKGGKTAAGGRRASEGRGPRREEGRARDAPRQSPRRPMRGTRSRGGVRWMMLKHSSTTHAPSGCPVSGRCIYLLLPSTSPNGGELTLLISCVYEHGVVAQSLVLFFHRRQAHRHRPSLLAGGRSLDQDVM